MYKNYSSNVKDVTYDKYGPLVPIGIKEAQGVNIKQGLRGVNVCSEVVNDQFYRHVGFTDIMCEDICGNSCLADWFSANNIDQISDKITQLLRGVSKTGRDIIVPHSRIAHVMSEVYENYRGEQGDIYARYNIPSMASTSHVQRMTDMVINIITADVKVNLGMDEHNQSLSAWVQILGDFNSNGLRRHSVIKLRERKPRSCLFNMNY
jgi:hypothetical protein